MFLRRVQFTCVGNGPIIYNSGYNSIQHFADVTLRLRGRWKVGVGDAADRWKEQIWSDD